MLQAVYALDGPRRRVVLDAVVARCREHGWTLLASHVRSNHVHIVVDADREPERIMNDLKSYASRVLNQPGFDTPQRRRRTRHGSPRWLRDRESVPAGLRYVVEEQGGSMAVFVMDRSF